MAGSVLNLALIVDADHVAECAAELYARLKLEQWRILAALAAEIVARAETVNLGQRVLVVPAAEAQAELGKALGLKVAGRTD